MRQLFIGAVLCVVIFTACDLASNGSLPIDDISESGDDPNINPTITTDIPAVDPWSVGITTELRTETINNETVYLIDTWRDLEYLSANFISTTDLLTYTYHVTKNIRFPDLTDSAIPETAEERTDTVYESFYVDNNGLVPIGADRNPFIGTFDGSYEGYSYVISDLVIHQPSRVSTAFFGFVGSNLVGATFKNVHLENIDVTGHQVVGGLIGHILGGTTMVENSSVQGTISAGENFAGGLIAYINASEVHVRNNHTSGSVEAYETSGGLIGLISSSTNITIEHNYSDSSVNSSNLAAGGFIGYIDNSNNVLVTKNYANGHVSSSKGISGGFLAYIGVETNNSTISDNYALGNVTTAVDGANGGFIGNFFDSGTSTLIRNYSRGTATTTNGDYSFAGGFMGASLSGNLSISYNYWDQDAQSSPGASFGIGSLTSNTGAAPLQASPQQSDFQTWNFDGEDAVWVWNDGAWPTLAWQESN